MFINKSEFPNSFNDLSKDFNPTIHVVKEEDKEILKSVLEEVKIGTADSITIADNMLRFKNIEIPLLKSLLDLLTQGRRRDAQFAQEVKELKDKVINEIQNAL